MSRLDLMTYSPVNFLMVDWGLNQKRFNECGLPRPRPVCDTVSVSSRDCCVEVPIQPAIETYDWARWLPEIIVGIDDPSEDIAADYSRAAAISFAKTTRALQREIVIPLQKNVCTYPIVPIEFENIIGVIGAGLNDSCRCRCDRGCHGHLPDGVGYVFDPARSEINIDTGYWSVKSGDTLRLLVWAAPTESACEYDTFLYEFFRAEIVARARLDYVRNVHFRDRVLLQSLQGPAEIDIMWAKAKLRAMQAHSFDQLRGGSGLFGRQMFRGYR